MPRHLYFAQKAEENEKTLLDKTSLQTARTCEWLLPQNVEYWTGLAAGRLPWWQWLCPPAWAHSHRWQCFPEVPPATILTLFCKRCTEELVFRWIAWNTTDLFHGNWRHCQSLNNASCRDGWGERSCPRSATAIHSVTNNQPSNWANRRPWDLFDKNAIWSRVRGSQVHFRLKDA